MNLMIVRFAILTWYRIKGSLFGPLAFLTTMFLVEGSFWLSVNGANQSIGTYSQDGILVYIFSSLIASQVVSCIGEPDQLSEHIESGQLDRYLLKPVHYRQQMMSLQLGIVLARLLLFAPISFFLFRFFSITLPLPILVLGLLCLVFASLLNYLINHCLACLTFYFHDSYAFISFKETLFWILTGALVPLDLFPQAIKSVLLLLPSAYIVYYPVKVLTQNHPWQTVLMGQVFYLFVFSIIAAVAWTWGRKHYAAYGS